MKYRKLGRTGFEVSEMAHGLWGMSGWSGSDDQESLARFATGHRSGLQLLRHRLGIRRRQERRSAGRNPVAEPSSDSKRLYAASKIPPMNGKWPARSAYKYQDVFPAGACFQARRPDPEKTPGRLDRCAAVSRLGRQLDRRAGVSQHGRETQARRNHSVTSVSASIAGNLRTASRLCAPAWWTQCR